MGKRGPKPKKLFSEKWSPGLAYAIGLLASDGCLSRTFYAIDVTSKDKEQLENFSKCLGRTFTIGKKNSGALNQSYRIQFKNVLFYNFLLSVGLTPAKSKTIGPLKIPPEYFFDFLRGSFDGDGSTYSYFDPRWKSSFMFYTTFVSASRAHILWLQKEVSKRLGAQGHITKDKRSSLYQLKYAKSDSMKLFRRFYPTKNTICLSRKRLKIERMLGIVGEHL
jgi:hypothetical protein